MKPLKLIRSTSAFLTEHVLGNPWTLNLLFLGLSFFIIIQFVKNNDLLFYRPYTVTLKGNHGLYVSVNPDYDCPLSTTAETEGSWETFHIIKMDDRKYTLYDQWDRRFSTYLNTNSDFEERSVISIKNQEQGLDDFFLTLQDDGTALVSDGQGLYWCLSADQQRIVTGPKEQAASFQATVIIPVIPIRDTIFLLTAAIGLLISLVLYRLPNKSRYAIFLLLIAAVFYRLYNITTYNFLFLWDEQFHAVVAKNFLQNPLEPVYYMNPILPFDFHNWIGNHIWLHKEPLFMWQMAIFIKLFGPHAWAIRIPDLIGTVLLVWIIYRMGVLLVNYRVGYLAALFFTSSYFLLTLCTGSRFTDHNDVVFLIYVTLSIWAWLEYIYQGNRRWQLFFLVLIGLFAGCAILTKWLVGLLVFSGWGLYILAEKSRRKRWKNYGDMLLSLGVCILVFLPWQLYILQAFPLESQHEFGLNTKHFFSVVEDHSGGDIGFFYHLAHFSEIFGIGLALAVAGICFLIYQITKPGIRLTIVAYIVIIFLFYGLAATKMLAFPFILVSLIYLALAALLVYLETVFDFVITKRWIASILFISILLFLLDLTAQPNYLIQQHYYWRNHPSSCMYEREMFAGKFKEFNKIIPEKEQPGYVVINCPLGEVGHMMFYTDVAAVYPTLDGYNFSLLKETNYRIAYMVIEDQEIPDFIKNDTTVLLLHFAEPIFQKNLGKCGM